MVSALMGGGGGGGGNGDVEFTEVSFPGMSPGSVSLESGNTSGTGL